MMTNVAVSLGLGLLFLFCAFQGSECAAYGETCTDSAACTDANQECPTADPKNCVCKTGYVVNDAKACLGMIDTTCDAATDCIANADCTASKCACKSDYTANTEKTACEDSGAAVVAASFLTLLTMLVTSRLG